MLETSVQESDQPLSRREAAAQDKLDRILEAATSLFAEKGFHGTTVPDVANAASVGAGTIYRYFDNKEDLVNGVFVRCKTKLKLSLEAGMDTPEDIGLEAKFDLAWRNLCRFAKDNPQQFCFLEMQEHSKYLSHESKRLEREVLAPLRLFAYQGKREGVIRQMPAMALIAMVWGAFVGLFKANALGYTGLNQAVLDEAGRVCWQMIARR